MGTSGKRNAIRKDLIFFALPALLVFSAGMAVSGWDLVRDLVKHDGNLTFTSVQNMLGLALVVVGLGLNLVAAATLRRFYSASLVIREEHQLITHGLYRFIRHPIYLGLIMVAFGVPVFASSSRALLIMVALVPLVLNRIRMEEALLTEEFGDLYRSYKKSSRKLIPFIF